MSGISGLPWPLHNPGRSTLQQPRVSNKLVLRASCRGLVGSGEEHCGQGLGVPFSSLWEGETDMENKVCQVLLQARPETQSDPASPGSCSSLPVTSPLRF